MIENGDLYHGDDIRGLRCLIGRKVASYEMSEERLTFRTEDGQEWPFLVEGDCCSHSYFHDLIGAEKFANGPVTEVKRVELDVSDHVPSEYEELVQVYGYALTTEHDFYGPQTIVFSFRNDSNGYYGGDMRPVFDVDERSAAPAA